MRLLKKIVLLALLAGLLIGAGIWAGYEISSALQNRHSLASRAKLKLDGYYNAILKNETQDTRTVITNKIRLDVTTVFLPLSVTNHAGGITTLGNDGVLITDREGKIFLVRDEIVEPLNIASPDNNVDQLRAQLSDGTLGDVEINFKWVRYNDILLTEIEGISYLLSSYTEWQPDAQCFNSTLARLSLNGHDPMAWRAEPGDWEILARTNPCLDPFESGEAIYGLEAGGRLAHLESGRVVWTSGAYERDDRHEGLNFSTALAQDDATDYGKVLIVDVMTGEVETFAKGLRNPQGVTVDGDGQVWVTDHGMRGGDELNLITKGANYGFPAVSYGTKYNRKPAGNRELHADHDGYTQPAVAFVPSIAPSSLIALENFHYAWDGGLLIGALSGSVHRVHHQAGTVRFVEPIKLGARIRDMDILPNGRIVVWTDERKLFYITPQTSPDPMLWYERELAAIEPKSLRQTAQGTFTSCLQCHGVAENEVLAGPSLYGICGRTLESSNYDAYSGVLAQVGGTWTRERLSAFIADPETVAPGTSMAWGGLESSSAADALADMLCRSPSSN